MAWGKSWPMDKPVLGVDLGGEDKTVVSVMKVTNGKPELIYQSDNLIFICDTCTTIYDPDISGFQALIDAARKDGWKITFHIGKDGYAMSCPKCKDQ